MSAAPRPLRFALRLLVVWAVEAVGLYALAAVFSDVRIDGWEGAFSAVAVIGLLNAVIWPLLVRFALPLLFWTFGLLALLVNGALVVLAGDLLPSFHVDGVLSGIVVALVLTVANLALSALLAIDDEDSYFRWVIARRSRHQDDVEWTDVPGVFFLEIDGLSIDTLRRAVRDGHVPNLARWLREGTHRLVPWECDLSSQTGASQAGLLHGHNADMPAFRWYEKDRGRTMVSNHPADAAELERRISDGAGLLAAGGASRGNLFSGDAPRVLLTLSGSVGGKRRGDAYAFLADPYNLTRTLALAVADIWLELIAARRQRRRDVLPRVDRGGAYPLLRAATTVVMRDLNAYTLIGDILRGVPVAYSTFVGYDEVAHHSGVERRDTLDVLRKLDRQLARIEAAIALAPRPYRLVVLSDHGQSQGATFRQRFGESLEDVVRGGLSGDGSVAAPPPADEGWGHVSAAATELAAEERGSLPRATRTATRRRRHGDTVFLGEQRREIEAAGEGSGADVIVLASGNHGLVYLPGLPGRVELERLEALHPDLVPALASHPGVGFVMVRTGAEGAVAIGADGRVRLADGAVEGEDPLRRYGPNAVRHLLRTDGFTHAPDLLVMSLFDPATEEVAAFEELVGSHGGLGGPQSRPFALVPAEWSDADEPIVGAEAMHRQMRDWLAETGLEIVAPAATDTAQAPPQPRLTSA